MTEEDDILTFEEELEDETPDGISEGEWKVLVVDDDEAVFQATRLALSDQNFDGRKIQFLYAESGARAREILADTSDIAVVLLDVVMETEHEGLEVADWIRNKQKNPYIRIVLRTGQPGYAPEKDVIQNYDINDYKSKTELTATKLYTLLITNLRTYRDLTLSEFSRVRSVNELLKAEINERIQAEQKLKDSEEKLLIAMNNMAGGIILVDEKLEVRSFNPQLVKMFALPPHLMKIGLAFEEIIRFRAGRGDFGDGDPEQLVDKMMAYYRNPGGTGRQQENAPDGLVLEVHHGTVESGGFVAVYTDITERKKAEQQLAAANDHLQAFHDRIGSELVTAQEMQLDLLPTRDEIAALEQRYGISLGAHFETSSELGGDIWGLHPIDDDRFGLYTVDFSGHGVGAALNTFRCHTFLADKPLSEGQTPADYLSELSAEMAAHLKTGHYATMIYAIIDVAQNTLTYSGACNPAPIFGSLTEKSYALGDGSGLPIGLTKTQTYENHQIDFPANSFLFLYSDALFEADLPDGGRMDMDHVKSWITAALEEKSQEGGYLEYVRNRFKENAKPPLNDDLTMVWLSR
ncbi:SpoIIE family protein phosphatase [Aestuariispira insulae]|uniref:Serine phosphatase RsbU (Regulator of sigma subunit) n=1 Tax=Aestuariispira insulae TaxID=1461337 RepID=A0A3D9HVU6_9PROT|nr:SpoIIE family protein phosphatase [Aestuariispira insulae]RED53511.1 serine phosphatase RsbU (regulator of sigma subunit) [Aestuariispira insulae]